MAKPKITPIPPLAFGQLRSQIDLDLSQMQDRVNAITNWVSEFDILDQSYAFQHRTAVYSSHQVRVIAVSSTPTVMKVNDPDCTVAIPLYGGFETWVRAEHFEIGGAGCAMYYPPGKRHTEGGLKSNLLVSVSYERLIATAKIMLGMDAVEKLDIYTPRVLETAHGSIDLLKVVRQACHLIDQFQGNLGLLKNFSPDESIVRTVVMMLAPKHFFSETVLSELRPRNRILDHLCDYVSGNLDQTFNLTKLELVSGISARVLQLEFKKRYATTPLQWVREQRLSKAHELLNNPLISTTVSEVAATCGFDNFGDFAKRYAVAYGELPSQTLKKALSKF